MVKQSVLDTLLDSAASFRNHFVLKAAESSMLDFVYLALRPDSNGKDLESMIDVYGEFCTQLEKIKHLNLVFSFKEITYFGDLGLALTVRLAQSIIDNGGLFVIIEPQPQIMNLLLILGLTDIIPVYKTEK